MSDILQIERPLKAIAIGAQIVGIVTNASLTWLGKVSVEVVLPLIALNSVMLVWALSWKTTPLQKRGIVR